MRDRLEQVYAYVRPIGIRSVKLCYITGFMFYLHHPLTILFSSALSEPGCCTIT